MTYTHQESTTRARQGNIKAIRVVCLCQMELNVVPQRQPALAAQPGITVMTSPTGDTTPDSLLQHHAHFHFTGKWTHPTPRKVTTKPLLKATQ